MIGQAFQDPTIEIRPENVYNMDETGVMLSKLGSVKVLVGRDDLLKHRGAREKRTVVTAVETISADGRYLDPMVIWPASTHRADWTTYPTPGWIYACSESGYTDSRISLEWLKRVFDPQTKERANGRPRLLIFDGFGSHETLEMLEFCFDNNIIPCRLPSHTSHKLQPCDVAVFGPLKAAYRDEIERLERGGVGTIGKSHFTYLYSPARARAFTKKNILSGWSKSGLFPFNPERVLKDIPRPIITKAVAEHLEEKIDPRLEVDVVQTPVTPVTPGTSEAVLSLQTRIDQEACALDEASRWRLRKHLQKFANAVNTSLAEQAMQKEQIRFLYKINNEAKVRRSTKSVVLGTAKVMSHEDLEEARAKRAAKEAAKEAKKAKKEAKKVVAEVKKIAKEASTATGKSTRGRKRKISASPKPKPKRRRETEESELSSNLTTWVSEGQVAPVARMI